MRQITVMHGPERRRRWTDEERLRILAEAGAPGACVADVARRHDISTARIYTWRNKLRPQIAGPEFAEAVVDVGDAGLPVSGSSPAIVVEVSGKVRMTVFPSAPAALVAATLKALR
ncbi:IS66-like element accessory protein TnpA [Novosphingobium humi]|jgi:transposase|uniref:Transposase n=1 Tax=Novosphingobium humi TaxID=2282397 RepID=A0ABY7TZ69_9SPHN|nr:transposase [Novosphingobium humi]WCT77369.1 transposase [Novosphingobium humi]